MSYSVGQIASLAGVSVRTLHHYDRIGLLTPADRSGAGYRRYGDRDLRRLQQIMFYRELGFALSDITDLVSDPEPSRLSTCAASTNCWRPGSSERGG